MGRKVTCGDKLEIGGAIWDTRDKGGQGRKGSTWDTEGELEWRQGNKGQRTEGGQGIKGGQGTMAQGENG